MFNLRPANPVTSLPTNTPPPPPNLTLTGITTILTRKCALLKAVLPGAKPGEQAKEESYILTEGQREGEIQVLRIDEQGGSVEVNDFGTILTLTFDKNGAKPSGPPGSIASPPGAPALANPGSGPTVPGLRPGMRIIPTRPPRMFATSAMSSPPPPAGANAPPNAAGEVLSPAALVPPAASPAPPPQSEAQLTPENQLLLMLQKEAANQNPN